MSDFDDKESELRKFNKSISVDIQNDIEPDDKGNFCWQCFVCGAIFEQPEKPQYCPLCKKEETFFFKVKPENKTQGENNEIPRN